MNIVEYIVKSIRSSVQYNPDYQSAPICILWTDRENQWQPVIPRMQLHLPEILVLGDYDPERKTGPAIWLRCVIESKAPSVELPAGYTPIIYLPGVSRQDLRAVESCPDYLKPLAELQYRGMVWTQLNSKDWTILAFLKSDQGGLNLDVAQDQETKNAMLLALDPLLDENVELLKEKRLDKDYFNSLLTGGDTVRDLLQWLDQGDVFKNKVGDNEWQAFVSVCKSQFGFNPDIEGILAGASKLAAHEGPWHSVWERYYEAPLRYPNIPNQIRKCEVPTDNILWRTGEGYDGWPQWNEEQEDYLRSELTDLVNKAPHDARIAIKELESRHGKRRNLVWADLGEAPLAYALSQLVTLAEVTANPLAGGNLDDLEAGYSNYGWQADDALVRALSFAKKQKEQEAVFAAIRAVYLSWADEAARHLQMIVDQNGYPGGTINSANEPSADRNVCIVFVDGMRLDVARRLSDQLIEKGCRVEEQISWAALPSVTATGKPAVAPVRKKIYGQEVNTDFEPSISETGQSLKGGHYLKKLLEKDGWEILEGAGAGTGEGKTWCESGNIDHAGHQQGWKLAGQLDGLIEEIVDRVSELLDAGWAAIRVVTDHGWILLPGGLPKIELPISLAENKWGRCAVVKVGAITDEKLYPWFWNPDVHFALAEGISCYRKGLEYAHGGLSLQECFTLELNIKPGDSVQARSLEITDLIWKGLRCNVAVEGSYSGLTLDIRTQAGNPSSSVVLDLKQLKDDGTASVVVEDDALEGKQAKLVLLQEDGELAAQFDTVIGGGSE